MSIKNPQKDYYVFFYFRDEVYSSLSNNLKGKKSILMFCAPIFKLTANIFKPDRTFSYLNQAIY